MLRRDARARQAPASGTLPGSQLDSRQDLSGPLAPRNPGTWPAGEIIMRIASALVTLVVSALTFASGVSGAHAQPGKGNYQVQVLRSLFGIPLDRPWGQVHFDTRGGSSCIRAVMFRRDPNLTVLKLSEKR
jgi:hypothetical protein